MQSESLEAGVALHQAEDQHQSCDGAASTTGCNGRREFMVRASVTAGGLILGLTGLASTPDAEAADNGGAPAEEVMVKLDAQNPLNKIGGYETVQTKVGKIVVARTGESTFAACSAVCTHRNGPIQYDAQTQQFFCPTHNSRFGQDGQVLRGPARQPLQSYVSQTAAIIDLKPNNPGNPA